MVLLMRCPCLNVTLHLVEAPKEEKDAEWLKGYTSMQKFGRGELGVGGVTMEVEKLVSSRTISHDWKVWKCHSCLNCGVDVCAVQSVNPTHPIVNMTLLSNPENDPKLYSPAFRVILTEKASTINRFDSPSNFDLQTWNKLQKQVDDYMKKEEESMQLRIEAYIKEQQEKLLDLQSNAYIDRKIIWYKICTKVHQQASANSSFLTASAPSNQPPSPTTTPVNQNTTSRPKSSSHRPTSPFKPVPEDPKKETPKVSTTFVTTSSKPAPVSPSPPKGFSPPKTLPLKSTSKPAIQRVLQEVPIIQATVSELTTAVITTTQESSPSENRNTQSMFLFEDEETKEEDKLPTQTETVEEEEEPIEETIEKEEQGQIAIATLTVRPAQIYGTSLPVAIPSSTWHPRHTEPPNDKGNKTFKYPHEEEQDEISKSFAVPLSVTRRIKAYI